MTFIANFFMAIVTVPIEGLLLCHLPINQCLISNSKVCNKHAIVFWLRYEASKFCIGYITSFLWECC